MKANKIASILVSKNGRLACIISVEDIMSTAAERANLDIPVDEVMHSPRLTIDSDKWILDAIVIFERCKASYLGVMENGEKIESIIHKSNVCRIALSENNSPYIVPACFGYKDNCLYFHSADTGKKNRKKTPM